MFQKELFSKCVFIVVAKFCRRAQEGVLVGRIWFRTADQLSTVSDLSVQEIKCMLYELAQLKLYIIL